MKSAATGLLWAMTATAVAQAEQPAWLIEARAREATLVAPVSVSSEDKAISFRTPLPLQGKLSANEKSYLANFVLGPNAIASCEILKEETDVAALLRQMALITFTDVIEPNQGRLELRGIERVDADIVGATPYLSLGWIYRVNDGKVQKLGALQQIAANHGNHGIYCALNDLGYGKSFTALARSLIESLQANDDSPAPYFREVSLVSIRDMRVGYSFLDLRHDKEGDILIDDRSVLLMPASADSLRTQDTLQQQRLRADGRLVSEVHVASNNGEIETNLALREAAGGAWLVEGTHQGREVSQTIAGGTPSTWLSQTALRRTLLGTNKPINGQASHTQWISGDPRKLTEATMKVTGQIDANTYTIRETAGGVGLDYVVDRSTGQSTKATMRAGPIEFRIERVYVNGKP